MAAVDITVPDLGDFDDVPVAELLVAVGDAISADQPLLVLESDKSSMEIPAGVAGVITELVVSVGATVSAGDVIARIDALEAPELNEGRSPSFDVSTPQESKRIPSESEVSAKTDPPPLRRSRR